MKKILFTLLAGMTLAGCQNTATSNVTP
ncbi:lipoprotein, partial [Cronobacter sakazakii]